MASRWDHLPNASLEGFEAYLKEVGHYEAALRLDSYHRRECERYRRYLEQQTERAEDSEE